MTRTIDFAFNQGLTSYQRAKDNRRGLKNQRLPDSIGWNQEDMLPQTSFSRASRCKSFKLSILIVSKIRSHATFIDSSSSTILKTLSDKIIYAALQKSAGKILIGYKQQKKPHTSSRWFGERRALRFPKSGW